MLTCPIMLKSILSSNRWEVKTSLDDGHCLLHSVIIPWRNQLPEPTYMSLNTLKDSIHDEAMLNIDDYLVLGFSEDSLLWQMNSYINHKNNDTEFGDFVPIILTKQLKITIKILDTSASGHVHQHELSPNDGLSLSITIHWRGNHFNGIICANTQAPHPLPLTNCTTA